MVLVEMLLSVLVSVLAGMYLWMRRCHGYWRSRGVSGPVPLFPFGNCVATCLGRRAPHETFDEIYTRYRHEPYAGFFYMHTPLLLINDLDIIKQVFVKEFQDFNGRGAFTDPDRDMLSGNLFFLSGQPWRSLRVKLSPAFTSGKIRYYFSRVQECAAALQRHVDGLAAAGGGRYQEDVRELTGRYTTDIVSSLVFGLESDCTGQDGDSALRLMGKRALEPSFFNGLRFQLFFFASDIMRALRQTVQSAQVNAFFHRLVSDTVTYREEHDVQRADLLNLLIQLKNKGFLPPDKGADGTAATNKTTDALLQKLTMNQVVAQAFLFFTAGFETSSTTSSFLLYELAKNPDVQRKVTEEIDQVLEKHNGEITYEAVQSLPYLDAVINETLRLYPPVPFLTREVMRRRELPGTGLTLEKGQVLVIPVSGIQKDADIWQKADTFDPERFTEANKASIHPMAFLPFGDGPRICIGMRLAQVQVKAGLMALLSRYSVSRCPATPDQVVIEPSSPVPAPRGGLPVFLSRRTAAAASAAAAQ